MELPQPRPFGTEGRKPTHDFLQLYSSVQQDPRPSQGSYLKTHDFLQPLEQVGKHNAKEVNSMEETTLEKPPLPAPLPSVEHILPGGIGTYSISHVSYFNQRVPKPEGAAVYTVAQASSTERNEENSNCSSYSGSGFTLWEESAVKRGKTGKENIAGDRSVLREAGSKMGGQWTTSSERPSLSSSNNQRNNTTFSSHCSSQTTSGQKNQSFMNMIKSAKGTNEEEDEDDEEDFLLKKEPSSDYKGNLTVKVDGKSNDQKANTPRSKHSATEQRRRSKINDRFQMLREIIPHNDQKRDKASFLLEVIEYIQFLQEKVHKYEGSYQEWNHYPAKLMPWRTRPAEGYVDPAQGMNSGSGPALKFSEKFEESNTIVSPVIPRNAQNPVDTNTSTATAFKAMDYHPNVANNVVPIPMPSQPNIFTPGGSSGSTPPIAPRLASDTENMSFHPQSQLWQNRLCTNNIVAATEMLKEQELTIESGTISISTVYSQGLLNTLTQALQSSGVDLTQASISVQIDLGKRSNSRQTAPISTVKEDEVRSDHQAIPRSRVAYRGEEPDQALKRHKTGKS